MPGYLPRTNGQVTGYARSFGHPQGVISSPMHSGELRTPGRWTRGSPPARTARRGEHRRRLSGAAPLDRGQHMPRAP